MIYLSHRLKYMIFAPTWSTSNLHLTSFNVSQNLHHHTNLLIHYHHPKHHLYQDQ